MLSKIFGLLGVLIPVTISAKVFIQQLWRQKLNWNEPLNSTLKTEWLCITANLKQISQLHILWQYLNSLSNDQLTLHVFTDASKKAYDTVTYICNGAHNHPLSWPKLKFLHWKPRLELMAALTGMRLCKFVLSSLDHLCFRIVMWSDSQITLC